VTETEKSWSLKCALADGTNAAVEVHRTLDMAGWQLSKQTTPIALCQEGGWWPGLVADCGNGRRFLPPIIHGERRCWPKLREKHIFSKTAENYFLCYAVATNVGSAAVIHIPEIETDILLFKRASEFPRSFGLLPPRDNPAACPQPAKADVPACPRVDRRTLPHAASGYSASTT
jgi:hypothetical protein